MLVTQCLTSLSLISEENANAEQSVPTQQIPSNDERTGGHIKDEVSNAVSPSGEGLVEALIGTVVWCILDPLDEIELNAHAVTTQRRYSN